jgi:hypothetical protein
MKRSDILWDLSGPEYEPLTQDERLERLTQYEMQTRLCERRGIVRSIPYLP